VTSSPSTLMPDIFVAPATRIRTPLILTRTGSESLMCEWLRKKTARARTGGPSRVGSRASPGPSATMQAPSDVIDVSSRETHRPRVA
jgi:hypothetical protein